MAYGGAPTASEPFSGAPAQGAPNPPQKKRAGLWIALGVVGALIIAGGIATPFIIQGAEQAEAERAYDEAAADLDEARSELTSALSQAAEDVESAGVVSTVITADRVSGVTVFDRMVSAVAAVEAIAVEPSGDEHVREKPANRDELRQAADQLRDEASLVRDEAVVVIDAGDELWESQLDVVDAAVQKGAEMIASGKVEDAEAAELQAALDALQRDLLVRGEVELGPLLESLDTTWTTAEATMVPTWEDIDGVWCGGGVEDCITIDLNGVGGTDHSTITYREMWGGCFNGLAIAKNGIGGANFLYCPAGVPTSDNAYSAHRPEPFVLNEDESRDRILFFQAPGGRWLFRQ